MGTISMQVLTLELTQEAQIRKPRTYNTNKYVRVSGANDVHLSVRRGPPSSKQNGVGI